MAQKVRIMALHGMSRNAWNRYEKDGSWQYDVNMLGFKYNMTDIQAAIGLAQIAKFAEMQKRRAEIAMRYQQKLAGMPIRLPTAPAGTEHSWHLYSIGIDVERTGVTRDQVIEDLARAGIGTSVHFIPLYRFTYYRDRFGWRAEDFPHSEVFFSGQLSLPLYPTMSDRDVDDVVEAIKASVDG
jgi:dTDP-4-amino-4,6-dideoxygalactose transaminase